MEKARVGWKEFWFFDAIAFFFYFFNISQTFSIFAHIKTIKNLI